MATMMHSQAGVRSFVSFLSLSLLVAILFILTGSYGSFADIVLHALIAGAVGWLIWNGFRFIKISTIHRQRLQHILSGGVFSLLLFNWVHNPYFASVTNNIATMLHLPANFILYPLAFLFGALIATGVYWLNRDIDKILYQRQQH